MKLKAAFFVLCFTAIISVATLAFSLLQESYGDSLEPNNRGENRNSTTDASFHFPRPTAIARARETAAINPGCAARQLDSYRAVDTGRVYEYPSIAHYAKLSRGGGAVSLSFRDYMSVLSVYKFVKPKRIVFHTYTDIQGKYWDQINSWENVKIEQNKIQPVRQLGGKHVSYIQHEADYIKLRAMHEYGGLALDFDVVIINGTKLRQEQRISECVLSQEGQYLNAGFHSCVKNSSYIAKWLEGYKKDYRPHLWMHNSAFYPAGILLDKDTTVCYNVHLDDTICVHPNAGQTKQWLGNEVKWRTKTASHYFLKKGIPNDDERLLQASHSLAQMFQYIHQAA